MGKQEAGTKEAGRKRAFLRINDPVDEIRGALGGG
jgi:hypothetical protein